MTDKATQLAQTAAEGLSRRRFLNRFGRTTAVAVATLAGLLLVPEKAQAGKPCYSWTDCPKGQSCYNGRCRKSGKV